MVVGHLPRCFRIESMITNDERIGIVIEPIHLKFIDKDMHFASDYPGAKELSGNNQNKLK